MQTGEAVTIVQGEAELLARTTHLFATATDVACAANDLVTWAGAHGSAEFTAALRAQSENDVRIRKVYRPNVLLDPVSARGLAKARDRHGAQIRITTEEINETIILDRRLVILAGDLSAGRRSYSVITQREAVQGVTSLFEAAWRSATDLAVFDARIAEIRELAPRVLDLLGQGVKDETAARMLGLGVRTYRRRVAELMDALGAESRFQAGVRARELGLV
ncbi:response regulator receiver protein [Beutenbergia cavernae DSM 12333]|uniref:Response regulator receiver protein n=1 Tax=Beutenbergia cavernae (strain ATCC BAA-8 / DSM 12333 / CCUG 43141 / JCM 11478 / NBRC 16432 / NCIMB 13614 / HKI 0122) TaxID=471853 RepID=C5BX14_BEUC1|nr:response regulator transcription factor [Beutenbergia cavernae]ACQ78689.1 response regulator receiver protein [Beutenbergia cavernae DSM 12333]